MKFTYKTDWEFLKQTEEELNMFENNKESFLNAARHFEEIIEKESKEIASLSRLPVEFRWKQFKKDCDTMGGCRPTKSLGVYYSYNMDIENPSFGPVGIMWDSETKYSKAMEAKTITFDSKETSKQDCYKFLKENRPVLYFVGFEKKAYRKVDMWTPVEDNEPTWNRYMVRYFEDLGKLPWWKYQLQLAFCKVNPRWRQLRSLVYRILVTK